jgi:ribonuclease Z
MNRRVLLLVVLVIFAIAAVATTWLGNRMKDVSEGARALEPREFEAPTVVFVGTGGSYANHRRGGPAVALAAGGDLVLVDAGRGVAEGLRAARIPVAQPRAVYLTSLLPENTVGLDDLLLTGWLEPRERPLLVVGPPGTRALVEGLAAAHRRGVAGQGPAFGLSAEGARAEAIELADGASRDEGTLRVRAAALDGGPVAALAYRFEADGISVVFGGVAWGGEALVALARGAGLLVHEAFFAESVEMAIAAGADDPERLRREAGQRTPLLKAGERARRARARALALVRLRPPPLFSFQVTRAVGETYRGTVLVPSDGEELALRP